MKSAAQGVGLHAGSVAACCAPQMVPTDRPVSIKRSGWARPPTSQWAAGKQVFNVQGCKQMRHGASVWSVLLGNHITGSICSDWMIMEICLLMVRFSIKKKQQQKNCCGPKSMGLCQNNSMEHYPESIGTLGICHNNF